MNHRDINRFWDKVEKTETCWNWIGCINQKRGGYGFFNCGGRKGKTLSVHRFSYAIHYGEIPLGMCVCHKCDNPKCVRPDHLFLGTPKDNVMDCFKKGRLFIPKAPPKPNQKVTESQKNEIKTLSNSMTQMKLATKFKLCQATISRILSAKE